MPVNYKMKNDLTFFHKLVETTGKDGSQLIARATHLVEAGAQFQYGFLAITIVLPEGSAHADLQLTLPASVTSVMKGEVAPTVALLARVHVEALLDKAIKALPAPGEMKEVDEISHNGVEELPPKTTTKKVPLTKLGQLLKDQLEDTPTLKVPESGAVDLNTRVKLKDAKHLNQAVFASDSESMYRVVAIGQVNLAARVKNKKLSIRAEGMFSQTITNELTAVGLISNNGYMSAHFDLSEVPAERIMGAILYAKGLKIKSRIGSIEEVKSGA